MLTWLRRVRRVAAAIPPAAAVQIVVSSGAHALVWGDRADVHPFGLKECCREPTYAELEKGKLVGAAAPDFLQMAGSERRMAAER